MDTILEYSPPTNHILCRDRNSQWDLTAYLRVTEGLFERRRGTPNSNKHSKKKCFCPLIKFRNVKSLLFNNPFSNLQQGTIRRVQLDTTAFFSISISQSPKKVFHYIEIQNRYEKWSSLYNNIHYHRNYNSHGAEYLRNWTNQLGNQKNPVFHKPLKHFQKFIHHWFWPKIVVRINLIQVITLTSNPFRRFFWKFKI